MEMTRTDALVAEATILHQRCQEAMRQAQILMVRNRDVMTWTADLQHRITEQHHQSWPDANITRSAHDPARPSPPLVLCGAPDRWHG